MLTNYKSKESTQMIQYTETLKGVFLDPYSVQIQSTHLVKNATTQETPIYLQKHGKDYAIVNGG